MTLATLEIRKTYLDGLLEGLTLTDYIHNVPEDGVKTVEGSVGTVRKACLTHSSYRVASVKTAHVYDSKWND